MQFMCKLQSPNANTAENLRSSQKNEMRKIVQICLLKENQYRFFLILTTRFRYY